LIIRGIGVISSILGTFTVPIWEKFPIKFMRAHDAEESMFRSYEVSSINTVIWSFVVAILYANDWKLAMLTTIGVGLAVAFNPLTSYFTSTKNSPVKEIVEATKTGPATTILSGLSIGMESSVWALVVIAVSFMCALLLYGSMAPIYVLYGVAMVGIGMLSHTGNNVAMDSFGPISDNANGIGEMAWHDQSDETTLKARQTMADLDAVGNTTKAITKGVAIASAVIAAVSLFSSFITDISRVQTDLVNNYGMKMDILTSIRISDTKVFIGFLIGGALPWLFSSLSIRAVSRAAAKIVEEVRRQFKIPGIMEGTKKPDYALVVGISTESAQKELIPLATIAILMPLAVGMVLQVEALGGFLAGVILSGQLLAVFMANAGGAWDNAKKMIEDQPRDLVANTGKGSERHKAAVVGDTVGDPLKDTAGPALNPMIKVVNLVSLLAAPVIVRYQDLGVVGWIIVAALASAMIWALAVSKKPVTLKS
jgi:K(+)-stimulated pyrophosphate-energized sodium pump